MSSIDSSGYEMPGSRVSHADAEWMLERLVAVMTAATTAAEALRVTCAFMKTTPLGSASDATASLVETSLLSALASLGASVHSASKH